MSSTIDGMVAPPIQRVASNPEATLDESAIDLILSDSFPASDSPPWTLGVSQVGRSVDRPSGQAVPTDDDDRA